MLQIPELDDASVHFPADPPLPPMSAIPEDFKSYSGRGEARPFVEITDRLFFEGGKLADFGLTPKEGVDQTKAIRAIKACLGSFAPKHEHKVAGVAYMLSEWFDRNPVEKESS